MVTKCPAYNPLSKDRQKNEDKSNHCYCNSKGKTARIPNCSTICDADAETTVFPTTQDQRSTGTNMGVLTVLKEKPDKRARKLTLKMVFIQQIRSNHLYIYVIKSLKKRIFYFQMLEERFSFLEKLKKLMFLQIAGLSK